MNEIQFSNGLLFVSLQVPSMSFSTRIWATLNTQKIKIARAEANSIFLG
jgi:hypothetical protein